MILLPNVKVHPSRLEGAGTNRKSGNERCQGNSNSQRVEIGVPRLVPRFVASVSGQSNGQSTFVGIAFLVGWGLFFYRANSSQRSRSNQLSVIDVQVPSPNRIANPQPKIIRRPTGTTSGQERIATGPATANQPPSGKPIEQQRARESYRCS